MASNDLSTLISGESVLYSIGGSILGPIFNWGKNKRRVEIQQELAGQALQRYEQTVLNAFREVDDALIEEYLRYLDEADFRRFAPGQNTEADARAFYERAAEMLERLGKAMN